MFYLVGNVGNKKIERVNIVKMQLGSPDETGRRNPEQIQNSEYEIQCDLIVEALGFDPENVPLMFNEPDLQVTSKGTIKIDYKTMMTEIDGVFAAGDIVRGASLVVWSIKDGRDTAKNIHNYLEKSTQHLLSNSARK